MGILIKHARPLTEFNPYNADHRRWLVEFINTGSWRHCPVRFYLEEECGYFVPQLQRLLLKYYTQQEFGVIKSKTTVNSFDSID